MIITTGEQFWEFADNCSKGCYECNKVDCPRIAEYDENKAKVEIFTSTNTGSPKLPTLEEVRNAPGVGTGTKYTECYVDRVVKNAYNFICRQLQASA